MGKARSILTLMLLGAAGSVFPTACDSGSTTVLDAALAEQGQVQLSLVGMSSSGTAYRLRQAIIVVQGSSSTIFLDSDLAPDSTTLGATVPAGFYTAFLQEGWVLERLSGPTGGQPLNAALLSPNPLSFVVGAGQSTRVPLRFAVGDETVEVGSFDIVLEVEETGAVASICSTGADCGAGQTCCPGGFLGTCQTLAPGASCALPDLTVDAETARSSMFFNFQEFAPGSCALEEGCVDGPGVRRLLSFATQTANVGGSDIVLGNPETTEGFEFAACHGHYHFEGYAEYQLLDAAGAVAARGHKQAFCLLDSAPVGIPGAPANPRYHCGFQGIQRGWSDVYGAGLDCQWVDITDVAPGQYTLRISINPERAIEEADYTNNTAEIPVTIGDANPLAACGSPEFGPFRDCGWAFVGKMRGLACLPGQLLTLGCGACGPGSVCQGNPVLRVCEGTEECLSFEALALGGGSCGQCVQTQFICPASGVYSVLGGAGDSSQTAVCQPLVQAQGPFGLLDPCPLSGPGRDCGWTVAEGFNALGCVPGQETVFSCGGCAGGSGGSCTGDPMIRVCAGNEPCTFSDALITNDDSCGLCSEARFSCPSDGVYTVMTGPFGGGAFSCEPTVSPPAVSPPAVSPPAVSPPVLPPPQSPGSQDAGAP